jgi:hypothetical protein
MGEAKRRGPLPPDGDRLPHFIFGRDTDAESRGGFWLAGLLVTDTPKDRKTSESELAGIVKQLLQAVKDNPNLGEAGLWRGDPPPDRYAQPYPEEAMKARMDRCISIAVRIDEKQSFTASGEPALRIWADDPALRGSN